MSPHAVEQAQRDAVAARARLGTTLVEMQTRLAPSQLASDAWEGVKGKGTDLAEGALNEVKKRPAAVAGTLGVLALFLARGPLKRAVSGLISRGEDESED
jgi:hypothetical protein